MLGLLLAHVAIVRGAYDIAIGTGLAYAGVNLVLALAADRRSQAWKPWLIPVGPLVAAQMAMAMGYEEAISIVLAPSIIVNVAMIFVFGHTLLPRREPLITRFRRFHIGHVTPELAAYTRVLTVLWTIMFAMAAAVSIAAALSGDIALWSWISFIGLPSAGLLLFLGEHVYRALRYGAEGRSSPLSTVQIMLDPRAWRDTSAAHVRIASGEHE
jgi:uncharacterized membrane protein